MRETLNEKMEELFGKYQLYYILEGETPVPCDVERFSDWFETAPNRQIAEDILTDGVRVSTVFLGLNPNPFSEEAPRLFETMIFGGVHDLWQRRYTTYQDALVGHGVALRLARDAEGQGETDPPIR